MRSRITYGQLPRQFFCRVERVIREDGETVTAARRLARCVRYHTKVFSISGGSRLFIDSGRSLLLDCVLGARHAACNQPRKARSYVKAVKAVFKLAPGEKPRSPRIHQRRLAKGRGNVNKRASARTLHIVCRDIPAAITRFHEQSRARNSPR